MSREDSLYTNYTKYLTEFIGNESLLWWLDEKEHNVDYSCENRATNSFSLIDHFLLTDNLGTSLETCSVAHSCDNMSDHSVISISLEILVEHCSSNANCGYHVNRPIWNKATEDNINLYKNTLDDMLTNLHIPWDLLHCKDLQCKNSNHILSINEFTESVLSACVEACQSSIPHSCPESTEKKSKEIPGWNEYVLFITLLFVK